MIIEIAGINFAVQVPEDALIGQPEPAYEPFTTDQIRGPRPVCIDFIVHVGGLPAAAGMQTVLATEDSWTLYRDRDTFLLSLNPPALQGAVVWTAVFDASMSRVELYCGDRMATRTERGTVLSSPLAYPLDQLLVMGALSKHCGAVVHCAAVTLGGCGLMFPGRSGAGKSTLSRQLPEKDGLRVLSDDRAVIRRIGGAFHVFGTPWPGEEQKARNESGPLRAVMFIRHGETNRLEPLRSRDALQRLLPVVSVPWYDPETMDGTLGACGRMISETPCYDFYFRPGTDVAGFLRSFLQEHDKQQSEGPSAAGD